MRKVTICKGLPGSGKSTWAKEKVAKSNCGIKRVNKDDLRAMLDVGKYSKGNEKFIITLRDSIVINSLLDGKGVIVDDTNFYPKHEERIKELVKDFNNGSFGNTKPINPVQVEVKFFDVSPEECIIRDLKRPNSVGSKVIWNMYNEYLKPEAEKIQPLKQDESLPHTIICDLDGTLCKFNGRKPYEYDKCDTDLLNYPIARILDKYKGNTNIIFLSGRDSVCRTKTEDWILTHGFDIEILNGKTVSSALFMRKEGDNRKDCIVKKELFDAYIKDKYYVDFVLDDRNQVVELWRSMGLTCLQVQDGDF